MDYKKIYDNICSRAKKEYHSGKRDKKHKIYYEGHHIIPSCVGGEGDSKDWNHNNIAPLTAREHFICHRLLTRIYPNNYKILSAFWGMCNQKRDYQIRYVPTSREYSEARELGVISIKHFAKNRLGESSSVYKKVWINKNDKNKRIRVECISDFLECGWIVGRAKSSIKDRGGNSKFSKKIAQYTLDGEFIKVWDSIADASRELNIVKNNICKVCKGQYSQAKGFKFEYLLDTTYS